MSTPEIVEINNTLRAADDTARGMQRQLADLQLTVAQKVGPQDVLLTDMSTGIGAMTTSLETLTGQLNENDKLVKKTIEDNRKEFDAFQTSLAENDRRVKDVIVDNKAQVEELRAAIAGKVGQSDGLMANLQNSVADQRKTIEELEEKVKHIPSSSYSGSPSSSSHKRSILDFKALSDCKTLEHGGGFLTWADSFRNVMDQFNPLAREMMVFIESLQ